MDGGINSLQLEEQLGRGRIDYDKTSKLCGQEEKNLENFIVKCPRLQCKRDTEDTRLWETKTQENKQLICYSKTRTMKGWAI